MLLIMTKANVLNKINLVTKKMVPMLRSQLLYIGQSGRRRFVLLVL